MLAAMGVASVGPAFRREVEALLRATRTKVYVLGEALVEDPAFVERLRQGASLRFATVEKMRPGGRGQLPTRGYPALEPLPLEYPPCPVPTPEAVVSRLASEGYLLDRDDVIDMTTTNPDGETLRRSALAIPLVHRLVARFGATLVPARLADAWFSAHGVVDRGRIADALDWYFALRCALSVCGAEFVRDFPMVDRCSDQDWRSQGQCYRCGDARRPPPTAVPPPLCEHCRIDVVLVIRERVVLPRDVGPIIRPTCLLCDEPITVGVRAGKLTCALPSSRRMSRIQRHPERRLQLMIDRVRDRYGARVLLWGPCGDRRGPYTGAKIAYQSFPDMHRLRWLGIVGADGLGPTTGGLQAYGGCPPVRLCATGRPRSFPPCAPGLSRLPGHGQHRMPAEERELSCVRTPKCLTTPRIAQSPIPQNPGSVRSAPQHRVLSTSRRRRCPRPPRCPAAGRTRAHGLH